MTYDNPVEPLLTINEISEYLRVTPRTIHTLTKKNILPRLKVGRLVRYRLSDVMQTFQRESQIHQNTPRSQLETDQ